jgi:hypothetical protein
MWRFGKKFLATLAGITVLTPAAFVAISVATPGIASARCADRGNEIRSNLVINGTEYVAERPDSGVCDGDNRYNGHFSAKVPGWRASVWIQNGGLWTAHVGSGYDMLNNHYSYIDDNSNSLMVLCVDNRNITRCGWGTNWEQFPYPNFGVDFWGRNFGF